MSRLPVDEDAIRTLARILTETGLTEIEVSAKDSRIRVVRMPGQVLGPVSVAAVGPVAAAGHAASSAVPAGVAAVEAMPTAEDDAAHPGAVTSPMVGIAFLSPEPGSAAYVAEGQQVQAGQTLLLIEAMKTFNQIKAPRAGTLRRILVASGSPVEYGQALMIIEA